MRFWGTFLILVLCSCRSKTQITLKSKGRKACQTCRAVTCLNISLSALELEEKKKKKAIILKDVMQDSQIFLLGFHGQDANPCVWHVVCGQET